MATLFESGALQQGIKPLLQARKLLQANTSPGFIVSATMAINCNLLWDATQPQHEISAIVTLSPTSTPCGFLASAVSMVRYRRRVSLPYLSMPY